MRDPDTVFEQCPDCGKYRVKLSTHRCDGPTTRSPTREERVRSAEADPRDDDDDVLLLPSRTVDGSYAYHEADADGLPACGGGGALDDEDWLTLTRREARERSHSPCKTCLRIAVGPSDTASVIEAAEQDATET
ncbi:hypothetical protein [Haloglomus salinum]|jgi:hypothetical protein|uniref:hypothetical protein n=1 Tax=Haloglomus salinum TaxID=2962673 RepID=UPI0020C954D8|nr:hypothetical protein [Haloglomus salinum]